MNNYITEITEGRKIEMQVNSSYIPLFNKLKHHGYELPDLEFHLLIKRDLNAHDHYEIYVAFSGYDTLHFLALCDENRQNFESDTIAESFAMKYFLDSAFYQLLLLGDLYHPEEIIMIIEKYKTEILGGNYYEKKN